MLVKHKIQYINIYIYIYIWKNRNINEREFTGKHHAPQIIRKGENLIRTMHL